MRPKPSRKCPYFPTHDGVCGCPKFWTASNHSADTDVPQNLPSPVHQPRTTVRSPAPSPPSPSAFDQDTRSRSPSPSPCPSSTPAPQVTCFFWYHGTCRRGASCARPHRTHATWPITPPPGYVHWTPCRLRLCPLREDLVGTGKGWEGENEEEGVSVGSWTVDGSVGGVEGEVVEDEDEEGASTGSSSPGLQFVDLSTFTSPPSTSTNEESLPLISHGGQSERKRKREQTPSNSELEHRHTTQETASVPSPSLEDSHHAPTAPFMVSTSGDCANEREFNLPSGPRSIHEQASLPFRARRHANQSTQHSHPPPCPRTTAPTPDNDDDIGDFFAKHHVSASPAVTLVRWKRPRHLNHSRAIQGDHVDEVMQRGAERDQRSPQLERCRSEPKARKRLKSVVRRHAVDDTPLFSFASGAVNAENTDPPAGVEGGSRVLVDYELPVGEARLEWDTDLVRRMVGEIE